MRSQPSILQSTGEVNVGKRLRELRGERRISIRSLAEQSGLNVNTLSLIENGKTSPSVSTLQRLAAALEVPITAFFETETVPQPVVFSKASERQPAPFLHGTLTNLAMGFAQPGLEPFLVSLDPHAGSGENLIVHTGLEFVFCLEGSLGYEVGGQEFTLELGDSLVFEAHLPHRWRNLGGATARTLLLLCPEDARDRPDERHFEIGG
jgi:transcriptional regulator with XRE-family HTH domain